jgi:hypothetical protein
MLDDTSTRGNLTEKIGDENGVDVSPRFCCKSESELVSISLAADSGSSISSISSCECEFHSFQVADVGEASGVDSLE